MKTTYIASTTVTNALRAQILRMQNDLVGAQQEATTGRRVDVGLALGRATSIVLDLRGEAARLDTSKTLNDVVATRLDVTQEALTSIDAMSNQFISTILGARNAAQGQELARETAMAAMSALIERLNTDHNGQFLFAGIATDTKPVAAYFTTPPSAAKSALDAAFQTAFGMAQNDPAALNITPAAMTGFVDGAFAQLFADPDWGAAWSAASDTEVMSRVAPNRAIETSVSANAPAFRKLMQAFAMVAELGVGNLGQGTFEAVIDKAIAMAGAAQRDLGGLRSTLGVAQDLVARSSESLERRRDGTMQEIGAREGVDQYSAATRVNELITQLEASYKLTARIGALSLINYL
jgi:flagellar hook-associated protein 3 FlgL